MCGSKSKCKRSARERDFRYIGVETSAGQYDAEQDAISTSKLAFEWRIQSAGGEQKEIVTVWCRNTIRPSGIPFPKLVPRQRAKDIADLQGAARKLLRS